MEDYSEDIKKAILNHTKHISQIKVSMKGVATHEEVIKVQT